jgi:DNA polymerase-3 subunit delta'
MLPPWLSTLSAQLGGMGSRMPHAILLHGQAGIGKRLLGRVVARGLLCESPDVARRVAGGCGVCPACVWFDQGNHPDFRRVTTEVLALAEGIELADEDGDADGVEIEAGSNRSKRAPSKEIKVDQIRALHGFLAVATHRSGTRLVLLYPLEALNDVAANALLKMLEEPPPRTVFILVADHLGRIPATIVSRCHKVLVTSPSKTEAIDWLKRQGVADAESALALAGGAPLAALELAQDEEATRSHQALVAFLARPDVEGALATAESFGRSAPASLIHWIQLWLADCISVRLATAIRYHPAQFKVIAQLAGAARLDALMTLMQRVNALRRTIDHPLNTRLMLESLLIAYAEAMTAARP